MNELEAKLEKYKKMLDAAVEPDEKAFAMKRIEETEAKIKEAQVNKKPTEEKKQEAPKPVVKKPAEGKKERVLGCNTIVRQIKQLLIDYEKQNSPKKASSPAKPKRVSSLIADGISRSISAAVRKELTAEKVVKIKVDKLEEASDVFQKGLKLLRESLSGIASTNNEFIDRFATQMKETIAQVKEKQKAVVKNDK